MDALKWLLLSLSLACFAGCDGDNSSSDTLFHSGRERVTQGEYARAIPLLSQYLEESPRGHLASRAGLMLGKAYLGLDQLDEAEVAFESVVRDFPQTLEGHKCRYKLALLELLRDHRQAARERFLLLAQNPDGPLAPEARAMAALLARGP